MPPTAIPPYHRARSRDKGGDDVNTTNRQLHLNLAARTGLIGAALTFGTLVCVEIALAILGSASPSFGRALLVAAVAAAAAGLMAAWIGSRRARRVAGLLDLVDAWLRGNLALRAGDMGADELGELASRLDLVAENLEEDEQDLDRLRESNTRLADQVRALAVVEERNRLARELHDTVKQHLFSLAMTASAVRTSVEVLGKDNAALSPGILEMIGEIEASAQAAQRETTRLIEDLRPAPLQERGLAAALNDYALLFGAQQHLLVYLDVQCNAAWIPAVVTEQLYRVAQEALHNVAHHADATRVDISLTCSSRRILLTIEDNGVGFDTRLTRKGLGISSMQERLMTVGGRLNVDSRLGTGTVVAAEVDITPQQVQSFDVTSPPQENPERPNAGGPWPASLSSASSGRPDAMAQPGDARAGATPFDGPHPEAWSWLGERLVIPVGQTWPWLPADEQRHLREPLIGPGTLTLREHRSLLGLRPAYTLQQAKQGSRLLRILHDRGGYAWDYDHGAWRLQRARGLKGRAVLERNEQPLAAMQYRGRQMDTWTEVVYDDRSYTLHYKDDVPGGFVLRDGAGEPVLDVQSSQVTLIRTLPLPLVAMALARIVDESASRQIAQERKS